MPSLGISDRPAVRRGHCGRRLPRLIAAAGVLLAMTGGPNSAAAATVWPNLPLPTLGGKQLWADRYLYSGWRIQENVLTGHARLLDPGNVRRGWGSVGGCRQAFERLRAARSIAPYDGHLVLLLHGLGRSRASFSGLEAALRAAGYQVSGVGYPSTRRTLAANAATLDALIAELEGVDRISFVTHSLGGLLVRELLARGPHWRARIEIESIVMTAPPSRGSALADRLQHVPPVNWILGAGLAAATTGAVSTLPAPDAPFGIVAGGNGRGGHNPWLAGDDDFLVTVEETRLPGAADWVRVDAGHTFIMNHPRTVDAILRFLDHRSFAPVTAGADVSASTTGGGELAR